MSNQNSPSKYFNNYDYKPRQDLLEDLTIQTIRMNGLVVRYMPRNKFERNHILGEDITSTFDQAVDIEAYPKNVDNFEGEGNILSKFGLETKNQMTFTVSRKRWKQSMTEKLVNENGLPFEDEESTEWLPNAKINFLLEDASSEGYDLSSYEPRPGDLLYLPVMRQIYEITYVDRESLFYEHGILLTYDLKTELFRYSNEEFNTGDSDIDQFEELYNRDENLSTILLEDGNGEILLEDEYNIVLEGTMLQFNYDNELFQKDGSKIVNFEDMSPFVKVKEW